MPELDLQPLVMPRPFRKPCLKIVVFWPRDDPRRNAWYIDPSLPPERQETGSDATYGEIVQHKRADAVVWGVSVAFKWIEDSLPAGRRFNIDLNLAQVIAPWTLAELDLWGGDTRYGPIWWERVFQHPQLALRTWTGVTGILAICPGAKRYPFGQSFAWGSGPWHWSDERVPPVAAMGDYHFSMFLERNEAWVKWLSSIPRWWPAYQAKWMHGMRLLRHELAHMLAGLPHPVPEDSSILSPSQIHIPGAGLNHETRERMLADPRWWL